jgi:hypothetical protein
MLRSPSATDHTEPQDGEASPRELAARLDQPISTVSYHVRQLRDTGLIQPSRTQLAGRVQPGQLQRVAADRSWCDHPPVTAIDTPEPTNGTS